MVQKILILKIYRNQFKLEELSHASQYFVSSHLALMTALKRFGLLTEFGSFNCILLT